MRSASESLFDGETSHWPLNQNSVGGVGRHSDKRNRQAILTHPMIPVKLAGKLSSLAIDHADWTRHFHQAPARANAVRPDLRDAFTSIKEPRLKARSDSKPSA